MRSTIRLIAAAGVCAVVTSSCTSTSENAESWAGTIDTLPSGVVVVSNPEQGMWTDRTSWKLEQVARIGTRLGSGPEMFGDVSDIDVDPTGRVYVFDRQAQNVKLFERDGSYVGTLGRPGHGPGEFAAVNGIAVDRDGRLWVNNIGNVRYTVFDTSGALVMEPQRIGSNVRFAEWRSVFGTDGGLYEPVGFIVAAGSHFRLVRYDTADQQVVDSVGITLSGPAPPGTRLFGQARALTPHGWQTGDKYTYRLATETYARDTVRIIERVHDTERLSQAEHDSASRFERQLRSNSAQRGYVVETSDRPVFQTLLEDDRGYLWVLLAPEPDDVQGRFDVFDEVGRYLGQVAAPDRVEYLVAPIVRGTTMYYVTKDELDVPYVVVAKIEGRR